MGRHALGHCNVVLAGQQYMHKNAVSWLNQMGATIQQSLQDNTTHVVVCERYWGHPNETVKKALDMKAAGADIEIVSFSWVEDCCESGRRKREPGYSWEELDHSTTKATAQLDKTNTKSTPNTVQENPGAPKSRMSLMVDVLNESTEPFFDENARKALERRINNALKAHKQLEKEERQVVAKRLREQAKIFGLGAQKAREDLFSDNHHIYTDRTGFKFDVVLTKVEIGLNRNERHNITIYESNAMPHTYAVNVKYCGTELRPMNKQICAMGSTFLAAFRNFKEAFRESTHGDWDSRMSDHFDRLERERERTDSKAKRAEDIPFSEVPFQYHPPKYGPCGELSEKDQERMELIRKRDEAARQKSQEYASPESDGRPVARDEATAIFKSGPMTTSNISDKRSDAEESNVNRSNQHQYQASKMSSSGPSGLFSSSGTVDNNGDDHQANYYTQRYPDPFAYLRNGRDLFGRSASDNVQKSTNTGEAESGESTGIVDLNEIATSTNPYGYYYDSQSYGSDGRHQAVPARGQTEEMANASRNLPSNTIDHSVPDVTKPNLGQSILGKRKAAPMEEAGAAIKQHRQDDGEDKTFSNSQSDEIAWDHRGKPRHDFQLFSDEADAPRQAEHRH